jgi:hypothetical protein
VIIVMPDRKEYVETYERKVQDKILGIVYNSQSSEKARGAEPKTKCNKESLIDEDQEARRK